METLNMKDHVLAMVTEAKQRCFLKVIAKESGVPEAWLKAFSRGTIEKPNVLYVQAVYEYLAKEPLQLKKLAI